MRWFARFALTLALAQAHSAAGARQPHLPLVRYPPLPRFAASAEEFAPAGWQVETRARGDLDGDGAADLVLIFRDQDPANIVHIGGAGGDVPLDTNPRILAVAFAGPHGGYRLALQNHVLIPRSRDLLDSAPAFSAGTLAVERGVLRLYFERIHGTTTFRFRWQDGTLRLIGYDYSDVAAGCLNVTSINYLTRRVRMELGWIDGDRTRIRWRRLPARDLMSIARVGDGVAFDPEHAASGSTINCPGRRHDEGSLMDRPRFGAQSIVATGGGA